MTTGLSFEERLAALSSESSNQTYGSTSSTIRKADRKRKGGKQGAMSSNKVEEEEKGSEDEPDKSYTAVSTHKFKRSSKNKPMEVTSKRPVSRKRLVVGEDELASVSGNNRRDPRFDALSGGTFDPFLFKQSYGFIRDYQKSELEMAKEAAKKDETLKPLVTSLASTLATKEREDRLQSLKSQFRKQEMKAIAEGEGKKAPYHLKQSVLKQLVKVDAMVRTGKGIDAAIESKRKRNASHGKRFLPYNRRS